MLQFYKFFLLLKDKDDKKWFGFVVLLMLNIHKDMHVVDMLKRTRSVMSLFLIIENIQVQLLTMIIQTP